MHAPVTVRIAGGRRMVSPDGKKLDPATIFAVDSAEPYWARALACGDIIAVPAIPAKITGKETRE